MSSIKKSIIEISKVYKNNLNLGNEIKSINRSGDSQKKLDILSDKILIRNLMNNENVKAIASEEVDDLIWVNPDSKYLVAFDPLDGSGNINLNMNTGTIFGIFDFDNSIIEGKNLVYAGYST